MTIICKTCFWKDRFEKQDWCKLIENEGGGSIKANQTQCEGYLRKGTEPKMLCSVCGKNTFGESSTSDNTGHYCSDCHWEIERREYRAKQKIKRLENIEIVRKIVGSKKLAVKIIKELNP